MIAQSLSIDVPGNCPNNCKFCVSKLAQSAEQPMLENIYTREELKQILKLPTHEMRLSKMPYRDAYARLAFVRDQGVDTVVLTGTRSEPIMNLDYLKMFFEINSELPSPFRNIEIQTSGVGLAEHLTGLRELGVQTIALSLASFEDAKNVEICQMKESISIVGLCRIIKQSRFNLRLCLNMNDEGFIEFINSVDEIDLTFDHIPLEYAKKHLQADQITFRHLYASDSNTPENEWIREYGMNPNWWNSLNHYIQENGVPLQRLPFGAMKYSLDGLSVVIDNDSMGKENYDVMKYLIFRRNGKLYTRWDDPASLVF